MAGCETEKTPNPCAALADERRLAAQKAIEVMVQQSVPALHQTLVTTAEPIPVPLKQPHRPGARPCGVIDQRVVDVEEHDFYR